MNEPMTNEQAITALESFTDIEVCGPRVARYAAALRRVVELEADHNALAVTLANEIAEKVKIRRDHEALRTQLDVAMRQIEVQNETIEQYAAQVDQGTEAEKQLDAIAKEVGPEPKYISAVVDSGMGCTETYIPMHALDHYKHRAEHLALKYIELREAGEAVLNEQQYRTLNGMKLIDLLARGK